MPARSVAQNAHWRQSFDASSPGYRIAAKRCAFSLKTLATARRWACVYSSVTASGLCVEVGERLDGEELHRAGVPCGRFTAGSALTVLLEPIWGVGGALTT